MVEMYQLEGLWRLRLRRLRCTVLGDLWRLRLRGLGMRQLEGCAEALIEGPFTVFIYISVEHDDCLSFCTLNFALELCIVYISRGPRMCA